MALRKSNGRKGAACAQQKPIRQGKRLPVRSLSERRYMPTRRIALAKTDEVIAELDRLEKMARFGPLSQSAKVKREILLEELSERNVSVKSYNIKQKESGMAAAVKKLVKKTATAEKKNVKAVNGNKSQAEKSAKKKKIAPAATKKEEKKVKKEKKEKRQTTTSVICGLLLQRKYSDAEILQRTSEICWGGEVRKWGVGTTRKDLNAGKIKGYDAPNPAIEIIHAK